jgi:hypothetical protein
MAHFAQLDENNVVIQVIVAGDEYTKDENGVEDGRIGEAFYSNLIGGVWKQTSYNGNFRRRFAGVGYTYNAELDAFIPPKPYESWVLNTEKADWEAPIPKPADEWVETIPGEAPIFYIHLWDEDNIRWVRKPYTSGTEPE